MYLREKHFSVSDTLYILLLIVVLSYCQNDIIKHILYIVQNHLKLSLGMRNAINNVHTLPIRVFPSFRYLGIYTVNS